MSGLLPAAVYGLEVPNGDFLVPAIPDFPAAFRITMAAIDPTAEPEYGSDLATGAPIRATLKLVRRPLDEDEDDLSDLPSDEDFDLEDDEDEDEELNGGPSDPSKLKKARKQAALQSLAMAFANGGDADEDMEVDEEELAQIKKLKGKAKAVDGEDEDDSEEDDEDGQEMEEFVLCTLDPHQHYQQTMDFTIGEDERVFFKVTGTHSIFLTGNYVIPVDDGPRDDYDDEDDYGELDLDEEDLAELEGMSDSESDELDGLGDPRVEEVDSDEEVVPKLVKKGKNKRPAAESDEEATLDSLMAKAVKPAAATTNGEKLSKKQQKKMKNNAGEAVAASATKDSDSPSGKKVSFAKNLEQGPTGTTLKAEKKANGVAADKTKGAAQKDGPAKGETKSALGLSVVQGVKIDVKKGGSGPAAKKNSKVSMRYIGKLADGKQFDANKKGKPFTFTLGRGEVIKGWEIGLDGIRAGDERRVTIPSKLGYGKQSLPGIPANSDLIFDVKCLEVN